MAGKTKAISQAQYDAMLESYRQWPGDTVKAGLAGKVHMQTAKRAWESGYPANGLPPICVTIREEMRQARELIAAEAAKPKISDAAMQRAAEERQAIEQRANEGRMAQLAQRNATALLAVIGQTAKAAQAMVTKVNEAVATGKDVNGVDLSVMDMAKLLRHITAMNKTVVDTALAAQEIERLRLGLPTSIVGLGVPTEMTLEQALEKVQKARQMYERAQEFGLLPPVIDVQAEPVKPQ